MRWAEHVVGTKEKRNTYRVLVAKPEAKRLPSRPRYSWENNIKINKRKFMEVCGTDSSGSG
jgi:hypothetical protein